MDFSCFDNMQEVINRERLEEISKTRQLRFYWGTAPTGQPHLGYVFPLIQIARMIKAGMHCTILFADRHAALDNNKTEWSKLDARTEFYTILIKAILQKAGADLESIRFVKGSDFQRTPTYTDDLLRLSTCVTVKQAQKATVEVIKKNKNPPLSNLIYPLMQALDEIYLETDFEFGGIDQRNIFMFALENLKSLGHNKNRSYAMNPIIPSLSKSGKMSASDSKSKIGMLDSNEDILKKSRGAFSIDGTVEDNGVVAIYKYIFFQLYDKITIERPEKYGGNKMYLSYSDLELDFVNGDILSIDLKSTMGKLLCDLISPIREEILSKHSELLAHAYPDD